jgi:hypothetical protein
MVTRHFVGFVGFKRQLPLLADSVLNYAEIYTDRILAFWPEPEPTLTGWLSRLSTQSRPCSDRLLNDGN